MYHREELMHFYLLNLNHQPKKMLYYSYYVAYLLTHVDSIRELQSKQSMTIIKHISNVIERLSNHCQKHLSNHCQTSIELSNVYRTTFNPNYTHWVPRNLNLNLLNRKLFFSLNRQSSNGLIVH